MKPIPAKRVERKVSFTSEASQPVPVPKRELQESGQSMKLLDGNFNEEDSAASFQEALQAWRKGAKVDQSPEKLPDVKAVGSFWSTLGGSEVNLERAFAADSMASMAEISGSGSPGASTPGKLPAESQSAETYAVERPDPSGGGMKKLCSEVHP
eukprot:Skav207263  [mRNA]  locus=scaffold2560:231280:233181:- [translate_table: standard]